MSKLLIVGTVAFDAIETPFGKTFKINYRLFTAEETNNLEAIKRNT